MNSSDRIEEQKEVIISHFLFPFYVHVTVIRKLATHDWQAMMNHDR
jgi:hypothetical protein